MKILYVEDEISKALQVEKIIRECVANCDINLCKSYASGIQELEKDRFDLILLDMSLPLYNTEDNFDDTNEFDTFAGITFLEEMKRTNLVIDVIIVTAFDVLEDDNFHMSLEQLHEKMKMDYPKIYRGSIHYNTISIEWSNTLKKYLKIMECNNENTCSR